MQGRGCENRQRTTRRQLCTGTAVGLELTSYWWCMWWCGTIVRGGSSRPDKTQNEHRHGTVVSTAREGLTRKQQPPAPCNDLLSRLANTAPSSGRKLLLKHHGVGDPNDKS